MNIIKTIFIFIYLMLNMNSAFAVLQVEITKGAEGAMPIAVIPFKQTGLSVSAAQDVSSIVAADLQRSGKFSPIEKDKLISRPQSIDEVNYKIWRIANIDHVVIGQIKVIAPQQYDIEFRLLDVFKGIQVLGFKFSANDKNLRGISHKISDLIYQQITGQKGAFDTKIAYVTVERQAGKPPAYKLQVADTDGYNPVTVLTSTEPVMSPSWSPDGTRVAYVSFENRKSEIYIQHLASQSREKVSSSAGINGAPVWSPDGKKLALTLSRGANTDIHILDLKSRKFKQITRHWAIDTEPSWLSNTELVFTSSRSGKPQLYRAGINDGKAKRITYEGSYNANAEASSDGRSIVFVQGDGQVFKIALMDLQTRLVTVLTEGALDESPSFAPNNSMILYAAQSAGRGVLAAVSTDGRFKQRLVLSEGDVRDPTWAPFK